MAGTRLLIAAMLVGGAAAAAALATRGAPSPVAQAATSRPAGTAGKSIDSIRIGMRGADWYELRRAGQGWRVESDAGSLPADPVRIRRLLGQLDALAVDGPMARDPSSHAAFGVAAEQAVHLVARSGANRVLDLRVGAGGFLRVADTAAVWKLDGGAPSDLFAGRDAWEDRAILELPVGSIRQIAIERDRARLELVRASGDASWSVTAGLIGAELDEALADRLAAQLERLEALDVTTATPEAAGLDRPLVQVRATDGDGSVRVLRLGPAMEGSHHARIDGGPVWVAASTLVDLLDRAPADWRDLRLVRAEADAIDEIRLDDRPAVGMTRGDRGWACPGGKLTDHELAVDLVDSVRTLRGERVAPAAAMSPLRAGSRRLLVGTSRHSTAIRIARGPSGWIAQSGRAAPVTVAEDAVAALFGAARTLGAACAAGARE